MIQHRGQGALAARDSLHQSVSDDQGVMQRLGPSWKSSLGCVLRSCATTNSLAPSVTVTGGLMREVAHSTKASQSSLCCLRRKIFENRVLSTCVRLPLANSMCDSRLLFGVESWPGCTGNAIQKLHVQRSIDSSEVRSRDRESDCSDDDKQSAERKEPEQYVLCKLGQTHTTVEIRARRLAYCPRLLKHSPKGLLALLQSPYRKRLVHRSWSQTILDDIYSLVSASGSRLADLGDPQLTPHAWPRCMREHPKMF